LPNTSLSANTSGYDAEKQKAERIRPAFWLGVEDSNLG
jgi:hypothetical protein